MTELVINIALLFGAVFCFWDVGVGVGKPTIPGAMTAAAWPRIILTCLIIALAFNIRSLLKAKADPNAKKPALLKDLCTPKFLTTTAMLIGYALIIEYTGFLATTFVFVIIFSFTIGLRKPLSLFLGGLISSVCMYMIFQLGLQVMLPRGVGFFRDFSIWLEILAT